MNGVASSTTAEFDEATATRSTIRALISSLLTGSAPATVVAVRPLLQEGSIGTNGEPEMRSTSERAVDAGMRTAPLPPQPELGRVLEPPAAVKAPVVAAPPAVCPSATVGGGASTRAPAVTKHEKVRLAHVLCTGGVAAGVIVSGGKKCSVDSRTPVLEPLDWHSLQRLHQHGV